MKLTIAASCLLASPLLAQVPVEIDLVPGITYSDSYPKGISGGRSLELAGEHYFLASPKDTGKELWKTDGTTAGTGMVVEVLPVGRRAYVVGADAATGSELFVADGDTGSMVLVHDLRPGPEGSEPAHLTLCDGSLYFAATGPEGDRELWRYDLPDAHAIELPFGGSGASLVATPPTLGSTLTLTVDDAPAGAVGVLAISAPVADPLGAFVEAGNALWIDPFAFTVLTASTAPTWTHSQPIPNSPALAGAQVNVQAWFLPPSVLPATTSNGLRLVLGS